MIDIELAKDWWDVIWLARENYFVAQVFDVLFAMLDPWKRLDGGSFLSMHATTFTSI